LSFMHVSSAATSLGAHSPTRSTLGGHCGLRRILRRRVRPVVRGMVRLRRTVTRSHGHSGRDGLSEPVVRDRPPARGCEPSPVVRAQVDEMGVGLVDEGPQLDLSRLVPNQRRRGRGYRAADPRTGPHGGMLDHTDVISSNEREVGDAARGRWEAGRGGRNGPQRDVLRGGRRVAPLVSTEYAINVSGPERSRKGVDRPAGQKERQERPAARA
jgi:hypothetical protein